MKRQMIPKLLSCLLITVTMFTACKSEKPERETPDPDSVEIRPEALYC